MTTNDVKGIAELAAMFKRKAEEEALIQTLRRLGDLIARCDDGASVAIVIGPKGIHVRVDHEGSHNPFVSEPAGALIDALRSVRDDMYAYARRRLRVAIESRDHGERAWAEWAEKRLAEIEAEHERAVS